MDTKNIKDEQIRKQIITASEVYRDKLAGRVFLYVYGESYFEVVFPTDRFRHLTGVNSSISAQEFYDKNFDYPEKPLKYKHIRRISD